MSHSCSPWMWIPKAVTSGSGTNRVGFWCSTWLRLCRDPDATQIALDIDSHKAGIPQIRVSRNGLAVSAGFDGFYRVWNI